MRLPKGRFETPFDGLGWRRTAGRGARLSQPALSQPRFPVRFEKTLIEAGASPAHPCTQWAEATGL